MKKIFLFITLLLSSLTSFCQYNSWPTGDPSGSIIYDGFLGTNKGFKPAIYADTTTANNIIPSITGIAGLQITTVTPNSMWYRSNDLTHWIQNALYFNYTSENVANKTATASTSTTTYPNWAGVENYAVSLAQRITDSTNNANALAGKVSLTKYQTDSIANVANLAAKVAYSKYQTDSTAQAAINAGKQASLGYTAANDANVVHNTGNETIAGTKTFSSNIVGSVTGNAATVTTNANLTGDITSVGNATTYNNIVSIAKGGTGTASPSLVAGTNVTVTGSWPNQTVNASGGGGSSKAINQIIPTLTKTANYRLLASDQVQDSFTTNSQVIVDSLPASPLDSTVAGAKIKSLLSSFTADTLKIITTDGSTIGNGPTSLFLSLQGETKNLTYKKTLNAWIITDGDNSTSSFVKSTLPQGQIVVGNPSGIATDTPFINDLIAMPQIKNYYPAVGVFASDTVTRYAYYNIDSIPGAFTNATGATNFYGYGGWLSASTSGGYIQTYEPFIVGIGNSIIAGHPWNSSALEQGNLNVLDVNGQIGYNLTRLTNMPYFDMGIGGQTTSQIRSRFLRDAIGLTAPVNDTHGSNTITHKPAVIILEGGVNDPFAVNPTCPLSTSEANITWMCQTAQEYGIPIVLLNSPGQGADQATQAQIDQITALNSWEKSGFLSQFNATVIDLNSLWNSGTYGGVSPYNNDNQHYSSLVNSGDAIHFTIAGYDSLANDIFKYAKLPVLTKMVFQSVLNPTNSPTNYNRPTGITIGSTSYTLPNAPYDTINITAPIFTDTARIQITSSANIQGSSTQSGWSGVGYYLDNNPTNQIWYTQRNNFKGSYSDANLSTLTIQNPAYSLSTPLSIKFDYSTQGTAPSYGLYSAITTGGFAMVLNGFQSTATINSAVLNVYGGISTTGAFYSTSTSSNRFGNLQFLSNSIPSITGTGISSGNTLSSMAVYYNPSTSIDQIKLAPYYSGGITSLGTLPTNIVSIDGGAGFGMVSNGSNEQGNVLNLSPIYDDTTSSNNNLQVRGIYYNPKLSSLVNTRHFFTYARSGGFYVCAISDSACIGYDSSKLAHDKLDVNGGIYAAGNVRANKFNAVEAGVSATLSSGTVTVADANITANSQVIISYKANTALSIGVGNVSASFYVPTITAGTSFVIQALLPTGTVNTTDNSTVQYTIVN